MRRLVPFSPSACRTAALAVSASMMGCAGPSSVAAPAKAERRVSTTGATQPGGAELSAGLADVFARRELSGAAVILDARSGVVVAVTGDQRAAAPGSSVKPLLVAEALRAGVIASDHRHTCTGGLEVAGTPLRCFGEHGTVDVARGLATSCNAFAFDVAEALGAEAVTDTFEQFGFEVPARPGDMTPEVYAATVGTGHGGLMVTPRELGEAYRTSLLSDGETTNWSDEASKTVREGLIAAVNTPEGTANTCALDGTRVAAKTGTADHDGDGRYDSWLVALAPADAPEIILVVHVADGGTAPEAAAPAAGEILRAWHAQR